MMSIDLYRLEVFASIVRHQSVTKACQELHSTQSALSQHLKVLREQFGEISERKGRHIEITERGYAFSRDIEPILSQAAALEKKYGRALRGSLTLGATLGPSKSLLPALMKQFERDHPTVEASVKIGPSVEISKLVLNAKVELAVIANPFLTPLLAMEWFRKEKLVGFVATDHPLARRKQIGADQFAALPLIIRGGRNSRNSTDEFLSALMAKGVRPNVLKRLETANAVVAAVKNGAGVGILYYDVIKAEVEQATIKILRVAGLDLKASSYIVYLKNQPLSRNAQDFLAILLAARSDDGASN